MFKIKPERIILISLLLIFSSVIACNAAGILPSDGGCSTSSNCGNYSLNSFVAVAINVAKWILGVSGSLALLFFIYGGIMFLISGGQSDKINSAKQIIINSLIGLVIVFASYTIIGFVISTVLKVPGSEDGNWATTSWYK